VSVRPRAHGRHLGRSLALWILSGASLRREPAPVAGCSRVSRPGQGRRVWTARGAISVRGHVSGRARASGSSGPAPARRIARGYRVPLHLGPQSGLRFPVSLATQPGSGQLSQPVSPPPVAGRSSWAGHRAGPSLPPGSPPFRRWGTDGPQHSTPHRTRIPAAGRGPDRRAGRRPGAEPARTFPGPDPDSDLDARRALVSQGHGVTPPAFAPFALAPGPRPLALYQNPARPAPSRASKHGRTSPLLPRHSFFSLASTALSKDASIQSC
jgi:hypothetical protein